MPVISDGAQSEVAAAALQHASEPPVSAHSNSKPTMTQAEPDGQPLRRAELRARLFEGHDARLGRGAGGADEGGDVGARDLRPWSASDEERGERAKQDGTRHTPPGRTGEPNGMIPRGPAAVAARRRAIIRGEWTSG